MNTTVGGSSRNVLTVDVEDYFHVSAFRRIIPYQNWDRQPSRVERSTEKVLDLLAEYHLRATFFILGWVAERHPSLVRAIQAAGHELGCHSYAHRLAYEQTPDEFRADTKCALRIIEDAAGTVGHAYRAPSFSITARSLWALEILLELGFTMDSSIFPTRNWLYGIPNAPRQPFRIRVNGDDLLEFPPATVRIGSWNIPATGGAYLRILPRWFQALALKRMADGGEPILVYFHPWELDPDQPHIAARPGPKFYHYTGLRRTEARLRQLFGKLPIGTLSDAKPSSLALWEIRPSSASRAVFVPVGP